MKIDQYGYTVSCFRDQFTHPSTQVFSDYKLHLGLPILNPSCLSLHYTISIHGAQIIIIKESQTSVLVSTYLPSSADANSILWHRKVIAPFFIEKNKAYKAATHTQFILETIFHRLGEAATTQVYQDFKTYCQKHFQIQTPNPRGEAEAKQ